MTEKESDLHPFGQQLAYYLHQTQLSQTELAAETDIPDNVISNMKHGKRLTGQNARKRVLKIINLITLNSRIESLFQPGWGLGNKRTKTYAKGYN